MYYIYTVHMAPSGRELRASGEGERAKLRFAIVTDRKGTAFDSIRRTATIFFVVPKMLHKKPPDVSRAVKLLLLLLKDLG